LQEERVDRTLRGPAGARSGSNTTEYKGRATAFGKLMRSVRAERRRPYRTLMAFKDDEARRVRARVRLPLPLRPPASWPPATGVALAGAERPRPQPAGLLSLPLRPPLVAYALRVRVRLPLPPPSMSMHSPGMTSDEFLRRCDPHYKSEALRSALQRDQLVFHPAFIHNV
jgi:hypothetical protein